MPNTCCVKGCKSNYLTAVKSEGATPVYCFPEIKDDRDRWLTAVGRDEVTAAFMKFEEEEFEVNKNGKLTKKRKKKPRYFVCRKHWPEEMETFDCRGKLKPIDPPSVFRTSTSDSTPSTPSPSTPIESTRPTKRALSSVRSVSADELGKFLENDKFHFDVAEKKINSNELMAFRIDEDTIGVQPRVFSPIPKFFIKIKRNLSFETYHHGSMCTVTTLMKNKIAKLKYWSTFDEIIRYMNGKDVSHKTNILLEQHSVMGSRKLGTIKYGPETITRAFEYYAVSRSCYSKMAQDFELPAVRSLQRITSKFGKFDETKFLNGVFSQLEERQRRCVLMLDEIYAKSALLLHGSTLFGMAANDPKKLATTVLSMMLKATFGGPEFIAKMLPVAKLDSKFQYSQATALIENVFKQGAEILAVIVDGNRVNQKFFKHFTRVTGKPWLAHIPKLNEYLYLLYDYVHVLKCVRNNWLTETKSELKYEWNGETLIAKWNILRHLHLVESSGIIKLSKLNEKSVFPKPIERQDVDLCLRVFSYETIAALETHPEVDQQEARGTIQFLKIMVGFWKIVNTKEKGEMELFKDKLRGEITGPEDFKLQVLMKIACMAEKMTAKGNGKDRVQQLTMDTGKALSHVCRGLIDMTRSLLGCGNEYVLLGWFTTDPLEKYFGKLRQGSGGTYFITVQTILEKTRILQTKLCLQLGVEIDGDPGHSCEACTRQLNENEAEVIDNLIALEDTMSRENLLSLVYIAGYVQRYVDDDVDDVDDEETEDDTYIYYHRYSEYFDALDRGELTYPTDTTVQWTIFCFIFFASSIESTVNSNLCGKFLEKQFDFIASKYELKINKRQCRALANIFLKKYSVFITPRSSKEVKLKELKLN